jgi:hypothetical protein
MKLVGLNFPYTSNVITVRINRVFNYLKEICRTHFVYNLTLILFPFLFYVLTNDDVSTANFINEKEYI